MKNRILKHWKSSLLGFILLMVAVITYAKGLTTLGELTSFLPFCLGLIYVKDSIFNPNE